jgi:hypothetical protein
MRGSYADWEKRKLLHDQALIKNIQASLALPNDSGMRLFIKPKTKKVAIQRRQLSTPAPVLMVTREFIEAEMTVPQSVDSLSLHTLTADITAGLHIWPPELAAFPLTEAWYYSPTSLGSTWMYRGAPWSKCSSTCGEGTQTRGPLECFLVLENRTTDIETCRLYLRDDDQSLTADLLVYNTTQSCADLPPCPTVAPTTEPLSGGEIAGITIGGIFGLIILVGCVMLGMDFRKKQEQEKSNRFQAEQRRRMEEEKRRKNLNNTLDSRNFEMTPMAKGNSEYNMNKAGQYYDSPRSGYSPNSLMGAHSPVSVHSPEAVQFRGSAGDWGPSANESMSPSRSPGASRFGNAAQWDMAPRDAPQQSAAARDWEKAKADIRNYL